MTPDSDRTQNTDLEALARAHFTKLTAAETKLLRAAPKGDFAVCGPNMNDDDPANDPSKAEKWGTDRQIRANLIRWLCVDRQAKELADPKGIQAYGAKIPEALDLSGATVPFALTLWNCRLVEEVYLRAVEIPEFDFQGTWVRSIGADYAKVRGSVFLRNGFHAEGEVSLLGAQIGGDLDCSNATFKNPLQPSVAGTGAALKADGIALTGSVFLRNGFRAEGEVRLLGAQIGLLDCSNATFKNPPQPGVSESGKALSADGIAVTGSVFLSDGFRADGEVRLLGAQIGGDLDCDGATFKNPLQPGVPGSGDALSAHNAVVKGNVVLNNGSRAEGEVDLHRAEIGGDLDCSRATFSGELHAQGAVIKGGLFWISIAEPEHANLNLINASVGALVDDVESWPTPGNLHLDGFVYQRISGGPRDAQSRLKWLERVDSFTPQPYRQLAKVLRDEGDEDGARKVLVEMERRQRAAGPWSWLLRWTIGYGYYPWRALGGLMLLSGLGWIIFRRAHLAGAMTPTDEEAYRSYKEKGSPPPHYPRFSPLVYSLENSLPLVKLGQADRWQPDPNPQSSARNGGKWMARLNRLITSPVFLRWFLWVLILLGWILATLFVAGVTGIVRKD